MSVLVIPQVFNQPNALPNNPSIDNLNFQTALNHQPYRSIIVLIYILNQSTQKLQCSPQSLHIQFKAK